MRNLMAEHHRQLVGHPTAMDLQTRGIQILRARLPSSSDSLMPAGVAVESRPRVQGCRTAASNATAGGAAVFAVLTFGDCESHAAIPFHQAGSLGGARRVRGSPGET